MLIFDLDATLACAVPAKRDPNADCQEFTIERNPQLLADCPGDGHYLCLLCKRFSQEEE